VRAYKEDGGGYGSCVLTVLVGPMECDPLDAGVVGDVFLVLRDRTAFKLPPAGGVIDVGECFASEL
jgi:hypothetical protein